MAAGIFLLISVIHSRIAASESNADSSSESDTDSGPMCRLTLAALNVRPQMLQYEPCDRIYSRLSFILEHI